MYSIYKTSQDTDEHFLAKWPIYLTHWGYTMCTVQAILAAGLVTQRYVKERATGQYNAYSRFMESFFLLHIISSFIFY
jgi:hypothetical protein